MLNLWVTLKIMFPIKALIARVNFTQLFTGLPGTITSKKNVLPPQKIMRSVSLFFSEIKKVQKIILKN